jgi:tRNA pseudouridine32 synthase/23S rRNA pseudouridine746 synthase
MALRCQVSSFCATVSSTCYQGFKAKKGSIAVRNFDSLYGNSSLKPLLIKQIFRTLLPMHIPLVLKNSHFVVVNKPAGTLSVPSRMGKADPRPVAGMLLQEQIGQRLFPIHRLDEEVSGILMFALTETAHKVANRWFELHEIVKTYEATSLTPKDEIISPSAEAILWECQLMRGKKRAYEAKYGKKSLTKAKLIICQNDTSIWHLQPLTGRSHQLRYEMAKHGFPIDGDTLYGSNRPGPTSGGICLRAVKLDFTQASGYKDFELPASISLESLAPVSHF